MSRALVLAGGGVAGIAWELGVLRGLQDVDPVLAGAIIAADVVVGTSAGAAVAAQITSGTGIDTLYQDQLSPTSGELEVDLDVADLMARFTAAVSAATSGQDVRRRIGALALAAETVDEPARRAVIEARLPCPRWPDRELLVTAVNARSGDSVVFSRDSGVDLVDAVAASCAVPGVWPPVTIDRHRYIDGGVRSGTNADLAVGCERVLIITPTAADTPQPWGNLDEEIALLKPAAVRVIHADEASVRAFGLNPLSPSTRGPSARAGRALGRGMGTDLGGFWM